MINANEMLLQEKNARRLTKRRMLPTRGVPLLGRKILQAPTMTGLTNMVVQKNSVATARPKVMTLHRVPALVIAFDIPIIVSPQVCQLVVLKTNPL